MNQHRLYSVMGAGARTEIEPEIPWRKWHDKTKIKLQTIIRTAYGSDKSEQVSEVVKIIREIIDDE